MITIPAEQMRGARPEPAALRQAIRVEGSELPSSKGVL